MEPAAQARLRVPRGRPGRHKEVVGAVLSGGRLHGAPSGTIVYTNHRRTIQMPCSLRFVYTPASPRLSTTAQQPNSVHKCPNPVRRGPILPFVYTIAIPRPPTTQARVATVYTNAPKWPREAISTDLCTLLRRRPGGEAHVAGVVTQPPTHTSSRSRQNKLGFSTGAREPQFQAQGEGRPGVPAAGAGAMPGRRHRRPGRRGLAPESPLASKSPLSDGACGGRPHVTS